MNSWHDRALGEIESIKPFWSEKYAWRPSVIKYEDHIDVFVQFKSGRMPVECQSKIVHVLRLRYESDYETAGRREAFVNPNNFDEDSIQFWPKGINGVNPNQTPMTICLEGTWGFHSHHHRERDGRVAKINRLLLELQRCLNPLS